MSKPALVFVESNTTGTGRLFAIEARRRSYRPVLLSADPSRYFYVEQEGIDVIRVDTENMSELLAVCEQFRDNGRIIGIYSSSEYYIPIVAELAQYLGLQGPNPESVRITRNKYSQRMRLKRAGVPTPHFSAASSIRQAIEAACCLGFPVIVKPVAGSGSVGVQLCRDLIDVEQHASFLLKQSCNERGQPIPCFILVEEFADGPQYSIETFNQKVIGITKKYLGPLPHFVMIGHDHPATLPSGTQVVLERIALKGLTALSLTWGPAHIEVRLTGNRPQIIEINPRLAGGFIPELVRLATGIDLVAETISLICGEKSNPTRSLSRYACIRFIVPTNDGIFMEMNGLAEARRISEVEEVCTYLEPGKYVIRQGDFRDRIGHVIASSDTAEAAFQAAEEALHCIQPCMQPLSELNGN